MDIEAIMLTVCIEIAEAGSAVFIPDTLIVLNVAIARSTLFLIYAYLVIPAFLFHGTLAPKLDPVLRIRFGMLNVLMFASFASKFSNKNPKI